MKKFLKYIPIFLAAIVLAVFFVPGFQNMAFASDWSPASNTWFTNYASTETTRFKNKSMLVEYAGETLVGIDEEGNVYRAENGLASNLEQTGVQLSFVTKLSYEKYTSLSRAYNDLIEYGNNILLFAGNDGKHIIIYKSTDQGKTWTSKNTGLSLSATSEGGHAYQLIYGNGIFALISIMGESNYYSRMEYRTSTDGETWAYHGWGDFFVPHFSYANGFFFFAYIYNNKILVDYTEDFTAWGTGFKPIDATEEMLGGIVMTKINNTYVIITQSGRVYTTPTIVGEWKKLNQLPIRDPDKIVPYENGAIVVANNDENNDFMGIYYLEIKNDVAIIKTMTTDEENTSIFRFNAYNTVCVSDNHVTIGASNLYKLDLTGVTPTAELKTYTRTIRHTVEFRDFNNNLLSSTEVADGVTAVPPAEPSRTGYTFVGWDKDISQPITADTIFFAQYQINEYIVTFKDEETGDLISTIKVPYSSQIPEDKIPTPTKDGYQFVGWNKNIKSLITSDTVFLAKFSKFAYLTINYPAKSGTFGLLNQFKKTQMTSVQIKYTIGDIIDNSELKQFLAGIEGWTRDFDLDGKWDYDVKFLAWDKQLPTHITEDITLTATYEKLNLVRVVYYSQLRFNFKDNFFHTFIAQMNIEKLIETGSKIKIEDFKRSDVDYEIYNAQGAFYNNLVGFEFQGWDKDITAAITEDTVFTAQYKMPTFEITYYDADLYVIDKTNNPIDFMGIENLLEILNTSQENYNNFKNLFTLGVVQLNGEKVKEIAQKLDLNAYLNNLKKYNDKSTRLITPIIVIDSDRPDAYGGIFTSGKIEVDSAVLQPFAGSLKDHDRSYYISPIMFTASAYPMSATVTFTNKLHSTIKSFNMFFSAIGTFFKTAWNWIWKILIVAGIIALISFVLYIFKEPLRRTIDNANKKRIEQKQENQQTKQQLKQTKNNNYRSTKNNHHYKSRRK